jgi:hypothetical protein
MATKCITIWTGLSIFDYQMKKFGKTYVKKKASNFGYKKLPKSGKFSPLPSY